MSTVLPPLQEVKDSIDLQRRIYKQALESRGNSEKQVTALLKISVDAGELEADAEQAWTEIKARETAEFEKADKNNTDRLTREKYELNAMDGVINSTIASAENLKFVIPDADKAGFSQAFKNLIHYEDGNFYLLKPLTKETIGQNLEAELFQYLGGDLTKLVERKATTVSSSRFIRKAKATPGVPGSTSSSSGKLTLGQIV